MREYSLQSFNKKDNGKETKIKIFTFHKNTGAPVKKTRGIILDCLATVQMQKFGI